MYKKIMVSVDELWLKGNNRKMYFNAVKKHIRRVAKNYHEHTFDLRNEQQRLALSSKHSFSDALIQRLTKLPGVHSVMPTRECEKDLDKAIELIVNDLLSKPHIKTFKVRAKRLDKTYPKVSDEINRYIATGLLKHEKLDLKVDVRNPDMMIDVKVMNDALYLSWEKFMATGGLPVGTSGHVVTLISGGFDSPVASYLAARRGCSQTFVFFYAYPFVGEEVKEKIVKMCDVLSQYENGGRLYVIPFGDFQNYIAKHCDEKYRTLLFRKYMMDVACKVGDKHNADAILMGDALAQVSSQTIHNMAALDKACPKLVLRPLVGTNKSDIIEMARKIGTHDISVIPHDDACSMFAPKHPIIKPDLKYWQSFIDAHPCEELISDCVENAEIFTYNIKGLVERKDRE